jgi:ATP-binding cassette subfamily B (MDR/TAP) protein 6
MVLILLSIWVLEKYYPCDSIMDEPTIAMANFNPPSTINDFVEHFKELIPFLWPSGKNKYMLRFMLLVSIGLIMLGRYVNMMVPIIFKRVVDSFTRLYYLDMLINVLGYEKFEALPYFEYLEELPYPQIVMFVLFRMFAGSAGLLNAVQKAIWVPIGQYTTKSVSLKMFDHLHHLSLRFHLNRKTGEILRVQGCFS